MRKKFTHENKKPDQKKKVSFWHDTWWNCKCISTYDPFDSFSMFTTNNVVEALTEEFKAGERGEKMAYVGLITCILHVDSLSGFFSFFLLLLFLSFNLSTSTYSSVIVLCVCVLIIIALFITSSSFSIPFNVCHVPHFNRKALTTYQLSLWCTSTGLLQLKLQKW